MRGRLAPILSTLAAVYCAFLAGALLPGLPRSIAPVVAVIVPILLTAWVAAASWGMVRGNRTACVVSLPLIAVFIFITGFSIGGAYLPVLALLIWSAVAGASSGERSPKVAVD